MTVYNILMSKLLHPYINILLSSHCQKNKQKRNVIRFFGPDNMMVNVLPSPEKGFKKM